MIRQDVTTAGQMTLEYPASHIKSVTVRKRLGSEEILLMYPHSEVLVKISVWNSTFGQIEECLQWRSLTKINLCDNSLVDLPSLPRGLEELACYENKLVSLPALPKSLKKLWCSLNRLATLPTLPAGLEELSCHSNKFTVLPTLPESLKKLWCGNNPIVILPSLPRCLEVLSCSYGHLETLPTLPDTLKEVACGYNAFTKGINPDCIPLGAPFRSTLRPHFELFAKLREEKMSKTRISKEAALGELLAVPLRGDSD
jgi:hypothetical protein